MALKIIFNFMEALELSLRKHLSLPIAWAQVKKANNRRILVIFIILNLEKHCICFQFN